MRVLSMIQSSFPALLMLALCGATSAQDQEAAAPEKIFSLAGRAQIRLTAEWRRRGDVDPPPHTLLARSAPRFIFSDIEVLELPRTSEVVEAALSDNPFLGLTSTELDSRMHRQMLSGLFHFFFPPPRGCLALAENSYLEQRRSADEEFARNSTDKEKRSGSTPRGVSVEQPCEFGPTLLDLYAAQLSAGFRLADAASGKLATPRLSSFFIGPMEQVELDGVTFFIFEARADRTLELADVQRFGLKDELRGSRAHLFWAIGAPSPFPFVFDPQRKDRQLLHVAFACLGLNGECRDDFQGILESVRLVR